jgi:HEAT repeats
MGLIMAGSSMSSKKHLFIAALVSGVFSCAISFLVVKDVDQNRRIRSLEDTIRSLQSSLAIKEEELRNTRADASHHKNITTTTQTKENHPSGIRENRSRRESTADPARGSIQILNDLDSTSETDPRSYAEKLQDLLSGSPTEERAAIASRFIFDKARDQLGLPDYALQSIYSNQTNADLKRVIAQVLSQRGNNSLLNSQIAEAQARLISERPRDRLEALDQLAKMHTTKAVEVIAPFLQDPDTTVRLAALFALRDTGNQQHVNLVEAMINDPDPSVSTLALDVLSSLKNLSSAARTHYSRSDIEAELPPIANP